MNFTETELTKMAQRAGLGNDWQQMDTSAHDFLMLLDTVPLCKWFWALPRGAKMYYLALTKSYEMAGFPNPKFEAKESVDKIFIFAATADEWGFLDQ